MRFLNYLLILLFSIPALIPLLRSGFFLSDDGEWMIVRLGAFFEALRNGQIPVRFLINLNYQYGYPLSDFAYPLFLYLGSAIHILGPGFIDTIKIILGLSLVLGSLFTYLFLRKKFDALPSIVGSFVYLYTPYHLFDLYKRGSIGELLAISIIPFIFYQIERRDKFLISIGVFSLILAHNSIALISLPAIFIYSLILNKGAIRKNLVSIFSPFVLGGLMSSFFFIPSVYDLRYIVFQGLKIADHSLFFADLNIFGISSVAIILLGAFVLYKNIKQRTPENYFFIGIVLYAAVFGTAIGTLIWNFFPGSFIIFPFRFLSVLPIGIAFISALAISEYKKQLRLLLAFSIILISLFASLRYMSPQQYLDRADGYYLSNFATTTANDEYMPKWVKEKPNAINFEKIKVEEGSAQISNIIFNSKNISFSADADTSSKIRIAAIYFPGWTASVNTKDVPINYENDKGLMEIDIPQGESNVIFTFAETPVRLVGDLISAGAFLTALGLFIKERKDARKNH